jgi:hypothetical protein
MRCRGGNLIKALCRHASLCVSGAAAERPYGRALAEVPCFLGADQAHWLCSGSVGLVGEGVLL